MDGLREASYKMMIFRKAFLYQGGRAEDDRPAAGRRGARAAQGSGTRMKMAPRARARARARGTRRQPRDQPPRGGVQKPVPLPRGVAPRARARARARALGAIFIRVRRHAEHQKLYAPRERAVLGAIPPRRAAAAPRGALERPQRLEWNLVRAREPRACDGPASETRARLRSQGPPRGWRARAARRGGGAAGPSAPRAASAMTRSESAASQRASRSAAQSGASAHEPPRAAHAPAPPAPSVGPASGSGGEKWLQGSPGGGAGRQARSSSAQCARGEPAGKYLTAAARLELGYEARVRL
jgi:hypothetical protein